MISFNFNDRYITFNLTSEKGLVKTGDSILIAGKYFQLEKVRFYISNLKLLNNDLEVYKDVEMARLFDFKNVSEIKIPLNIEDNFNRVEFTLGIDSTINCSGAYGGDLDPTNGMYWSWQSGYINFKAEAKSIDQKEQLTYHLGGYKKDELCAQKVVLDVKNSENVNVSLQIDELLKAFYNTNYKKLMIPGEQAVAFSKIAAKHFIVQTKN